METPRISDGNKSGVNCTRLKRASTDRANALASVVLPVPGKSSSNTCPPLASAGEQFARGPDWPCITRLMLAAIFWNTSRAAAGFHHLLGQDQQRASARSCGEKIFTLQFFPGFVRCAWRTLTCQPRSCNS